MTDTIPTTTRQDVIASLHRVAQDHGERTRNAILQSFGARDPTGIRAENFDDVLDQCDAMVLPSPAPETTGRGRRVEEYAEAYKSGMSVTEIAKATGRTYQSVYKPLVECGLIVPKSQHHKPHKPHSTPTPAPLDPRKALIQLLRDEKAKEAGFLSAADYEAFVEELAAETEDNGALLDDIIVLGVKAREAGMKLRECTNLLADVFAAPWGTP